MLRRIGIVFALLMCVAGMVRAEPRIALVIGNSSYVAVSSLPNPTRDATLIADTLTGLGFEVTLITDGDLVRLQREISAFGGRLRAAGEDATGLFYYAGHGVQSFGRNYLLPVDAAPGDAADLGLVAIEAENVLRQMASARNRTNIFILDACRNNPFADILEMNETGLAEMNAPTGTFLAYATAPGAVALDGLGDNSPFTSALAAAMPTPGQPIEQVFKDVRNAVLEETRGLQTPWDTSSLTADFSFAPQAALAPLELAEQQLWDSVVAARDPVQVMLFMRAYPDSANTEAARALLVELMALEVGTPVEEPPPVVAEAPEAAPTIAEISDFETAQAANTVESYRSFVATHPASIFVEAANEEIAALESAGAGTDPAPGTDESALVVSGPVTFNDPLTEGPEALIGQSIAELIQGSPLFAPIDGLPEELWKNQQCANCHQWTQEALCTQANVYAGANAERSMALEHPLGSGFKQVLRVWAEGGCQ